jgi:hypothetical protein
MADADNTPTASAPTRSRHYRRPPSPHITVSVNQEQIDNAIRRDSRHCWIAEAIKTVVPDMTAVTVDLQTIRFTDPEKRLRYSYLTPHSCHIALIDFDRGIQPEPFTFTLRRAAQVTRGGRPKGSKNGVHKSTKESRAAYERTRSKIRAEIYASADEVFTAPAEQRERVIRAMEDPEANLGPAMVFPPPNGNKNDPPVVVGGKPAPGNIARTRRFGLRELRE